MSRRNVWGAALAIVGLLADGCFGPDSGSDDDSQADEGKGGGGGNDSPRGGDGGSFSLDGSLDGCEEVHLSTASVDKVDLLFVVDNSGSMAEEQSALRAQFPHLITALNAGDPDGNGTSDFAPATDVHLGVVSSDLGAVGVSGVPNCDGVGDNGLLNGVGDVGIEGCEASFPPFISFQQGGTDLLQAAQDFGCVSSLGTSGCGFEQPLEAALKALWPENDRGGNGAMDPNGTLNVPNRIKFLGDPVTGAGTTGHGDRANIGFLRNDPSEGLSLISVVVVTNEEDCSSSNNRHFTPASLVDPSDPLAMQDMNLRCFFNKANLFDVQRYVDGLQALRPDAHQLVTFGAIVGVPPDLVNRQAREAVDFTDSTQREAHYQAVLDDVRMQEVVDPTAEPGAGQLAPSCAWDADLDGDPEKRAFPPRRIVEVVRLFEENGFLGSLCQSDLTEAVDGLIAVMGAQLGAPCLPRALLREDDGLVGCEVLWELPLPGRAPASTPVECSQMPFLAGEGSTSDGAALCRVTQLARVDVEAGNVEGWFYDDFSDEVAFECSAATPQRIGFTPGAKPPTGVRSRLRCCD